MSNKTDKTVSCFREDLDEVAAYSVGVLLAATALARALIDAGAVRKDAIRQLILDAEAAHEEAPPLMVKALEQFLMLIETDDADSRLGERLGFSVLTDFLDRLGKGCPRDTEGQ